MSNEVTQNAKFALQEILVSLADSLNDAQEALRNQSPFDQFGRPNTLYQLPYLDFSLKVVTAFETTQHQDEGLGIVGRRGQMRFQPVPPSQNQTLSTEVVSTISGRFIATVPNEGLPQTLISVEPILKSQANNNKHYHFQISVSNSAGESLANTLVEVNFDTETSELLSGQVFTKAPSIEANELRTDADGRAVASIKITSPAFNSGKTFVFKINVGLTTKDVSISK